MILADCLQGYGLVVVVEHGKGDMSLYGYNQSALVSVGSQVRAGQPIALVGSSGGQGRPSLYFEIPPPGSGGQSTAVVGKISLFPFRRNVLAFAALLALSSRTCWQTCHRH